MTTISAIVLIMKDFFGPLFRRLFSNTKLNESTTYAISWADASETHIRNKYSITLQETP